MCSHHICNFRKAQFALSQTIVPQIWRTKVTMCSKDNLYSHPICKFLINTALLVSHHCSTQIWRTKVTMCSHPICNFRPTRFCSHVIFNQRSLSCIKLLFHKFEEQRLPCVHILSTIFDKHSVACLKLLFHKFEEQRLPSAHILSVIFDQRSFSFLKLGSTNLKNKGNHVFTFYL